MSPRTYGPPGYYLLVWSRLPVFWSIEISSRGSRSFFSLLTSNHLFCESYHGTNLLAYAPRILDSSRPFLCQSPASGRESPYSCAILAYVLVLGPSQFRPCPLSAKSACHLLPPRRVVSTITYFLPCQTSHSESFSSIGPILGIVRELGVSISRTEYSDSRECDYNGH